MKEYPILFHPDMVRAIEPRRTKWQTRRTTKLDEVNKNPDEWNHLCCYRNESGELINVFQSIKDDGQHHLRCPYGAPGSILWVRENFIQCEKMVDGEFCMDDNGDLIPITVYQAEKPNFKFWDWRSNHPLEKTPWKPSIHMPKVACRIYLQNTGVLVQRLQDISEDDAIAEGIEPLLMSNSQMLTSGQLFRNYLNPIELFNEGVSEKTSFQTLIQKIHGPETWDKNPWVRRISFRVLSTIGRPEKFPQLCEAL